MDTVKIGKFLKDLRKEKGLTQSEVADHLYVSSKTISRWENGDGMPDINVLTEIADFYNITVDELLRGERKNIERVKIDYESKLNALNKYLFVSLGILGVLNILGVILGFVISKELAIILFGLGIIISSIIVISTVIFNFGFWRNFLFYSWIVYFIESGTETLVFSPFFWRISIIP